MAGRKETGREGPEDEGAAHGVAEALFRGRFRPRAGKPFDPSRLEPLSSTTDVESLLGGLRRGPTDAATRDRDSLTRNCLDRGAHDLLEGNFALWVFCFKSVLESVLNRERLRPIESDLERDALK